MQQESSKTTNDEASLEFDLPLVHRILLTDAAHLDSLSLLQGGQPPSFLTWEQFQGHILQSNSSPNYVVKRAFYDHIKESIELRKNWLPMHQLLLELHTSIRSLVPNRPDLHSTLYDPTIEEASNDEQFDWKHVILHAARSLSQLESEVRAETTNQWIHLVETTSHVSNPPPSFWILSILYLLDKAEICAKEKQDFYLIHIVAPRLHSTGEGFQIERTEFWKRFPTIPPPLTNQWIHHLMSLRHEPKNNDNERQLLRHSKKERQRFVITGWIESILLETQHETTLPEIFALDLETLLSIRNIIRLAIAGCSLGWHACMALGRSPSTDTVLQHESQGALLVQTMMNPPPPTTTTSQHNSKGQAYEEAVGDTLIVLAQQWNQGIPLQPSSIETLRGQTTAVLRGNDPVLKLFNDRIKSVFVRLATHFIHDEHYPTTTPTPVIMQTGNAQPMAELGAKVGHGTKIPVMESSFLRFAKQELDKAGLAFFGQDLAQAADLAIRVADLAYRLYADEFLDQMILDAL